MRKLIGMFFLIALLLPAANAEAAAAFSEDKEGREHILYVERESGAWLLNYIVEDSGILTEIETVSGGAGQISSPALVLSPGGDVLAAWTAPCGKHDAVFFSRRTAAGWEKPLRMSADKPYPAILPEFHADERSNVYISWLGYNGGEYVPRFAFLKDGDWFAEEFVPAVKEETASAARLPDMNKYVGFGDSVTAGVRRVPWGGDGYKSALQGLLREKLNPSANVVLRGLGGERTSGGVNRIDSVLREENPGYILIMEGINDLQARLAYSTILFNLQEMVRKSIEFGAVPVVGILPPRADSHAWQSYTEEFNDDYLRPYLREENLLQADHWKFFNEKPDWRDYLDPGDQHPNPAGYDLLGEAWFVALEPDAPPAGFTGWKDAGGVVLAWEPNVEYGHEGYNVYRSEGEVPGHVRLNDELLIDTWYRDEEPPDGFISYVVASVDRNGNESDFPEPVVIDPGSGGMCFIATAAFGSPLAEDVKILSLFRDSYLLKHKASAELVKAYYALSPRAADFIRKHPLTAAVVRLHLRPVAAAASVFVN